MRWTVMSGAAEGIAERRGWRRAWTKLRDAVRRRKEINKKSTSLEPMAESQPLSAAVDTSPAEPTTAVERVADLQQPRASLAAIDNTYLIPDDNPIEAGDADEPLRPMFSTRTGLSNERAQRLFEKYGIKYEPRTASNTDLIHDVRRVEKPVRIRIHYSCDECGTSFGNSKTCSQCGHRRCRDCHRDPPKRVREMLHEARQQRQEQAQQACAQQRAPVDAPMVVRATVTDNACTQPVTTQQPHMIQEGLLLDETTDSTQYQYIVQHRPHAGALSSLQPRAQLVRRKCHECETHFEPPNQAECQTCGHSRCKLCPYENLETPAQETQAGERQQSAPAPFIVATVQRVYKKPRQRVRWTCEQCQALFTDRERCQECGHRKCAECIRSP
jgi:hypothetical protein